MQIGNVPTNAGVFLGSWPTEPTGRFAYGPNAVLEVVGRQPFLTIYVHRLGPERKQRAFVCGPEDVSFGPQIYPEEQEE